MTAPTPSAERCEACETPDPITGEPRRFMSSAEGPGILYISHVVEAHHALLARVTANMELLRFDAETQIASLIQQCDEARAALRELYDIETEGMPLETRMSDEGFIWSEPWRKVLAEARRVLEKSKPAPMPMSLPEDGP